MSVSIALCILCWKVIDTAKDENTSLRKIILLLGPGFCFRYYLWKSRELSLRNKRSVPFVILHAEILRVLFL